MMFHRLTIFNAMIFAVAMCALSAPLAEARLGRFGFRKLEPVHYSESHQNSNPVDETELSSSLQNDEVSDTNSSDDCSIRCPSGSLSSISVCHRRGGENIEICTEAESFDQHKQNGDTCGFC
jgi:hypothetical protein